MLARFLTIAAVCFAIPSIANAQVSDAMNSFWSGSKTYSNTTPPGRYEGQTMGVYTMGNYVKRAPQITANIATVQLPSISAGCGGIDAFSGGFSFIDGDAIGDLLTAILQDAEGFAYMIAIDVVDQQIGSALTKLQTWIQELNSRSVNSCDAAAAIVGTVASQIPMAEGASCKMLGSQSGVFSDYAAGQNKCAEKAVQTQVNNGLTPEEKKASPINKNYAYDATSDNSIYSGDMEMREFLMSISGTVIIRQDTSDGEMKYDYLKPIALDENAVQRLMEGGDLKIHKCDTVECLNVEREGKTVTIAAADGFRTKVDEIITSVYRKVSGADSTAITTQEIQFIEQTTLPVYKAIDVYSSAMPNRGLVMMLSYSDLIAYDMVLKFLEDQTNAVLEGSQQIVGGEQVSFNNWREGVLDNRRLLLEQRKIIDQRYVTTTSFINQVSRLEKSNAARLVSAIAAPQPMTDGGSR